MANSRRRWTAEDNERFRAMVEAETPAEVVAATFEMTREQLRRRGYDIGLPLKWFKTPPAAAGW
jgi:Glu-tRNA(Gln) amidotransferase subunit E-like FAD-binding protein